MRTLSLKIKVAFIVTAMMTTLVGCGRKERPTAPDSKESTYPRVYPTGEGE